MKWNNIQWTKSRNCDIIAVKKRSHFSKFYVRAFSQTSDIRRNVSDKFIKPSMIIFTGQTNIYINTFSNTLTSQMATNHEINITLFHAPSQL